MTQFESHGRIVPRPRWWVHGQSRSQPVTYPNHFRRASGDKSIDAMASWTFAFHAGSAYDRNHWLSTTFTIAGVMHRQMTRPLGSYMTSARPFDVSSFRISSFATSTRTPAKGPQFSFRTPR